MARPRNADADLTRRRILESAIQRFGRDGLRETSLRAIAADVGVTFATVHHYYGSKSELYGACLEASYREMAGLRDVLGETLARTSGGVADQIAALARRAFTYARGQADVSRFLLRATVYEEEGSQRARRGQQEYLDVTSALLSPVVGRPAETLRIPLQGLMFVLTRLAVLADEELAAVGGTRSATRTVDDMSDYVAKVAVTTLLEPT